jgi:hypothetical protein
LRRDGTFSSRFETTNKFNPMGTLKEKFHKDKLPNSYLDYISRHNLKMVQVCIVIIFEIV